MTYFKSNDKIYSDAGLKEDRITDGELVELKEMVHVKSDDGIIEWKDRLDIFSLIEAEQQRRATRTEDVQRAIYDLVECKRNNDSHWDSHDMDDMRDPQEETYKLATQALEAYAPKEQTCSGCVYVLESSNSDSCIYCSVNKDSNWKGDSRGDSI